MGSNLLVDVLGWLGAAGLLVAYGLISAKKLQGNSWVYQLMNLAGSALLIVNSFYYGAFPSVIVNLFWIGIAVFTLLYSGRRGGRSGSGSPGTQEGE